MKQTYHKLQLDCLVMGGGNGSTKTANLLSEEGLNVITLPKTIDNDLYGTDMTFGFHSALDIATKCVDDIHTTASSHGRVFIVEIMGHKVGWLPCMPVSPAARTSFFSLRSLMISIRSWTRLKPEIRAAAALPLS